MFSRSSVEYIRGTHNFGGGWEIRWLHQQVLFDLADSITKSLSNLSRRQAVASYPPPNKKPHCRTGFYKGGGWEIRTLEGFDTLHAFQACALDRYANPPVYILYFFLPPHDTWKACFPSLSLVGTILLQRQYTFWLFYLHKAECKIPQKVLRLGPIRMGSPKPSLTPCEPSSIYFIFLLVFYIESTLPKSQSCWFQNPTRSLTINQCEIL